MISPSATTEATTFPDSTGIEPGANYHTVIEIEREKPTFNPLEVLGDDWNKRLYLLFTKSSRGGFVREATPVINADPAALAAVTSRGLIVPYYLYSMEYMFSGAPKGVRR
jgi:hypothetical protein